MVRVESVWLGLRLVELLLGLGLELVLWFGLGGEMSGRGNVQGKCPTLHHCERKTRSGILGSFYHQLYCRRRQIGETALPIIQS